MRFLLIASGLAFLPAAFGQSAAFRWPEGARAAVSLTYDDGLQVDLDHVIPDLEAVNLRGTFYVQGTSQSLGRNMEAWRAAARRGHELGNHTSFHPCLQQIPGYERTFVTPEWMLETYTVRRMVEEIRVMNTMLEALDPRSARTLAYPCGDETAGGASYVDAVRPWFTAARGYKRGGKELADPRTVDTHRVPGWAVDGSSGKEMIAWVEEAARSGSLAVFIFHGVGGGSSIDVAREEHRMLLEWLSAHRDRIWIAPFLKAMEYVIARRPTAPA